MVKDPLFGTFDEFGAPYSPCEDRVWSGRASDAALGPQYWHQVVRTVDLRKESITAEIPADSATPPVLIGYACDEGVKRNHGRPGARSGPEAIRRSLARMAYHGKCPRLFDLGDVGCADGQMESAQEALAEVVARLWSRGFQPRVLGGGHDIAYGHFKGFVNGLASYSEVARPRIGIFNLDAHFDLRLPHPSPHSGSPFYQILQEYGDQATYTVLGIQEASNAPELFARAKEWKVHFSTDRTCLAMSPDEISSLLHTRLASVDGIYLTIDLDGFSAAYAPGVSAPSPIGLNPDFALEILDGVLGSGLPVAMDIAEMNPQHDLDHRTARLAAHLLEYSLRRG